MTSPITMLKGALPSKLLSPKLASQSQTSTAPPGMTPDRIMQQGAQSPVGSESSPTEDLSRWKMSPEGRDLTEWVKSQYHRAKSQRLPVQKQWEYNRKMYRGMEYRELLTGRLPPPPEAPK